MLISKPFQIRSALHFGWTSLLKMHKISLYVSKRIHMHANTPTDSYLYTKWAKQIISIGFIFFLKK